MQRAGKAETEDTGAPGHTAEQRAESHTGELRGSDRSLGDEAGTHKKPARTAHGCCSGCRAWVSMALLTETVEPGRVTLPVVCDI